MLADDVAVETIARDLSALSVPARSTVA